MSDIGSLQLNGTILTPSSPEYTSAIQRLTHLAIRKPAFVAFPATFDDVPKIIQFARSNKLELAVKGGGANLSSAGLSSTDGGLVIDLAKLNKVQISDDRKSVTVEGGAKWGHVYEPLSKLGLDAVGGSYYDVGVGGNLTGGGWSYLNGRYGMGCDNIIEATVALADGNIVKASVENNPDLFMAIRGGLGQFGIVLEFVLRVYPTLGPINAGVLVATPDAFDKIIPALQQTLRSMGDYDKLSVNFQRDAQRGTFNPSIVFLPTIPGPPERAEPILAPIKDIAVFTMLTALPNQFAWAHMPDEAVKGMPKRLSHVASDLQDMVDENPFNVELFRDFWNRWLKWTGENELGRESFVTFEFSRAGVAKNYPAGETAFNKRDGVCTVAVFAGTRVPEFDKQIQEWAQEMIAIARASRRTGDVIAGAAHGNKTVEESFGEELTRKLQVVKAKYDPDRVWTKGFSP